MKIGDIISENNLSRYNKSDRYNKNVQYTFEEICIGIDDNENINYLFARFDEDYIDININNKNDFVQIEDIVNVLGDNFQEKKYDSEQQLEEYMDRLQ